MEFDAAEQFQAAAVKESLAVSEAACKERLAERRCTKHSSAGKGGACTAADTSMLSHSASILSSEQSRAAPISSLKVGLIQMQMLLTGKTLSCNNRAECNHSAARQWAQQRMDRGHF